jgi:hypothetical protein
MQKIIFLVLFSLLSCSINAQTYNNPRYFKTEKEEESNVKEAPRANCDHHPKRKLYTDQCNGA